MPNFIHQKPGYFSDLEKTYESSPKGWELYLRDLTLGDLYADGDENRCPWAWGHLLGGLDYLAAEIGPEKTLAELRKRLDRLEDPQKCDWLAMHRAGKTKKEGRKLASAFLRGDAYDEPMH